MLDVTPVGSESPAVPPATGGLRGRLRLRGLLVLAACLVLLLVSAAVGLVVDRRVQVRLDAHAQALADPEKKKEKGIV